MRLRWLPPPSALRGLPDRLKSGKVLLVLLAINLLFALFVGKPLTRFVHPEEGPTIVDLELSFSPPAFKSILFDWTAYERRAVRNHWWLTITFDSLFPVAYASLLFSLYAWIAQLVGRPRSRLFGSLPVIAAGLDVLVENAGLLFLTRFALGTPPAEMVEAIGSRTFSPLLVYVVSLAAALKITLLAGSLLVSALTLLRSEFGWVLRTCRFSGLSLLVGSLPLLVVGQGKDIIRGVVDQDTPASVRAFALLFLFVWALSTWYWGRVLLMLRFEDPPPQIDPAREALFIVWIPRALGTASLAFAALACFVVALQKGADERFPLAVFGLACGVLAAFFHWFVTRRRKWFHPDRAELPRRVPESGAEAQPSPAEPLLVAAKGLRGAWRQLPRATKSVVIASFAASLLFLVAFTLSPVRFGQGLGSMAVLYLVAANTVLFGSAAVFLGRLWKLPLVTLALAAATIFSFWNDNHAVRLVSPSATIERPFLQAAFDEWWETRRTEWTSPEPMPVVLVAAEGGGLRAAYWTAVALSRLQDRQPQFARHVFAMSGVSGGSLGVTVFAALVADQRRDGAVNCRNVEPVDPTAGPFQQCADGALSSNFLAPVLAKMLAPDLLQWFVPVAVRSFDRAMALEDAWAEGYREATDSRRLYEPFQQLWPGPRGSVPALLLNASHVETGRRILHSHVRFLRDDIPDAHDFAQVMEDDPAREADVPLATAAHDSARFAYVSPAGLLRAPGTRPRGHVVDGSYFENSGAQTLFDVVRSLRLVHPDVRFVVLYLCNSPGRCYGEGRAAVGAIATPRGASSLGELFAPVRALLGAREARGSLALEHLRLSMGDENLIEIGVCPDVEPSEEPLLALGWQRSHQARVFLSGQLLRECNENSFSLLLRMLAGER